VVGDRRDRGGDPRHQREAGSRISERGFEHIGQRHRAVVAQQEEPPVPRPGHAGGQQPGARHDRQTQLVAKVCGGGRGRRDALRAQHTGRGIASGDEDRGKVAPWSAKVRLDNLQHEACGHRRVERIAAAGEHGHRCGRAEVVGAGCGAVGAPLLVLDRRHV
jgi:hypothetical protein